MLNWLWGGMIVLSVVWGAIHGTLDVVTEEAMNGARQAVSLCITMLGVLSLWMGLMEVAKRGGVLQRMAQLLQPFLRWLFPNIPQGHPAMEHLASNMISNLLGLGWAATPPGIKAMECLQTLEEERRCKKDKNAFPEGVANTEMCTFLIVNISSLQLIPITVIAYRSEYGAKMPADIIAPAILATIVSSVAGVVFAKIMEKVSLKKRYEIV